MQQSVFSIQTRPGRVGSASFYDAFVASAISGPRLMLIGCDMLLTDGGRQMVCMFPDGTRTSGLAVGNASDISWGAMGPQRGRYMGWSCPIPASVYDESADSIAVGILPHPGAARAIPVRAAVQPYSRLADAGRIRMGAVLMLRNAIERSRASVVEAVEYHRLLGFERWFVYDNNSTDLTPRLLQSYGRVMTTIQWPYFIKNREGNNRVQRAALNHALHAFAPHCEWVSLLDLDEFVALPSTLALPATGLFWQDDSFSPRTRAARREFLNVSFSRTHGARKMAAHRASATKCRRVHRTLVTPGACKHRVLIIQVRNYQYHEPHCRPLHRILTNQPNRKHRVCGYHAQTRDRESPGSSECGAGGNAHTRRVLGCRAQYPLPSGTFEKPKLCHGCPWPTTKIFFSVDRRCVAA